MLKRDAAVKLGYVVHNLNDPAVERRCRMLELGGAQVKVAGFCRDTRLRKDIAEREPMLLGQSSDAAFIRRSISTARAMILRGPLEHYFSDCDAIIARNLEQLAIARTMVGARPLVYECLDIHRSLTGSGPLAKAVQTVEKLLLPRVNLLATSSPAFLREHFTHRSLSAKVLMIENKLLVEDDRSRPAVRQLPPLAPFRIGWFGMLRCKKTFAFLKQLVIQANGNIEVLISGKPSPAELPHLAEDAAQIDGMTFTGSYRYSDLPALYGQCHFAWTIDWFEEGLNSSWLLPNRLYEALAYGAVPIALSDIQVGQWLAHHNAGLLVRDPDQAAERLLSMTVEEMAALQRDVLAIDRSDVLADSSDCRRLVTELEELIAT